MYPKLLKMVLLLPKQALLITLLLKFGEMNRMGAGVMFGLWDVCYMRCVLKDLLLLLMIWKGCIIKFKKGDTKKSHPGCFVCLIF